MFIEREWRGRYIHDNAARLSMPCGESHSPMLDLSVTANDPASAHP